MRPLPLMLIALNEGSVNRSHSPERGDVHVDPLVSKRMPVWLLLSVLAGCASRHVALTELPQATDVDVNESAGNLLRGREVGRVGDLDPSALGLDGFRLAELVDERVRDLAVGTRDDGLVDIRRRLLGRLVDVRSGRRDLGKGRSVDAKVLGEDFLRGFAFAYSEVCHHEVSGEKPTLGMCENQSPSKKVVPVASKLPSEKATRTALASLASGRLCRLMAYSRGPCRALGTSVQSQRGNCNMLVSGMPLWHALRRATHYQMSPVSMSDVYDLPYSSRTASLRSQDVFSL